MKDVVFGLVAGAVGALAWAAVAFLTEYEIGWIAWGIGALVGWAVAAANREGARPATAAGVLAVAITVLAMVAGKYAAVQLVVPTDEELVGMFLEGFADDEYVISFLADDVAAEIQSAGGSVQWPEGVNPQNAASEVEYPPDVWAEAEARWGAMTVGEREDFREARRSQTRAEVEANLPAIRAMVTRGDFLGSFSPMDLIFFGLGIVTAFGTASGRQSKEEMAAAFGSAVMLAMLKVMLADGQISEEEVASIARVHRDMTGGEIPLEVIRSAAAAATAGEEDLLVSLEAFAPHLKEEGRKIVVRAALTVAMADGAVGAEERALVEAIAAAVGLSEPHLRETLAEVAAAG